MKQLVLALALSMALIACNDSPAVNGNVSMKISAATATGKTSAGGRVSASGRTQAVVNLTSVKVNFGEIKFEVDDDHKKSATDSVYEDTKLKGPFLVDLLSAATFVEQTIASVSVPNGNYEEIEFKFSKIISNDALNGKSISVSGTVNGVPFEFWSDITEELKIDFSDKTQNVVVNNNDLSLSIKLHLDQLLTLIQNAIPTGLTDKNNNGKIDLDPKNSDGYKDLYSSIKDAMKNETKLEDGK